MKNRKKRGTFLWALSLAGLATLIGVWYLVSFLLRQQGNQMIPLPHETVGLTASLLFGEYAASTWMAIGWTLLRVIIGISISFLIGGILGILAGLFKPIRKFLNPLAAVSRTIPTVAVVLVLISIIMGAGQHKWLPWVPVALTFVVAFPLFYESFASGMEAEPQEEIDALSLEGAKRSLQAIIHVYLPDAWPFIELSLVQSIGMAVKVSIMSEVLTATSAGMSGIGTMIILSRHNDGGLETIPAYSLIALGLMIIIDIPFWILKKKKNEQ